jgi:hypothetical protein
MLFREVRFAFPHGSLSFFQRLRRRPQAERADAGPGSGAPPPSSPGPALGARLLSCGSGAPCHRRSAMATPQADLPDGKLPEVASPPRRPASLASPGWRACMAYAASRARTRRNPGSSSFRAWSRSTSRSISPMLPSKKKPPQVGRQRAPAVGRLDRPLGYLYSAKFGSCKQSCHRPLKFPKVLSSSRTVSTERSAGTPEA